MVLTPVLVLRPQIYGVFHFYTLAVAVNIKNTDENLKLVWLYT